MMKIFSISKLFVLFMVCMFLTSGITAYALDEPNSVVLGQEKNSPLVGRINFEDVLAKAKDHSYDLKLADYDVLISKQEVRGARSEYFPKFNFNAGMEYTRNFRDIRESTVMSVGDAFINPYTRFQSILGITVAYNLFDFGVRGGN
jgi:outer membrane protein TolC